MYRNPPQLQPQYIQPQGTDPRNPPGHGGVPQQQFPQMPQQQFPQMPQQQFQPTQPPPVYDPRYTQPPVQNGQFSQQPVFDPRYAAQPTFQHTMPQQPIGGFGRPVVNPMDNRLPPPDRNRRKRTSTVTTTDQRGQPRTHTHIDEAPYYTDQGQTGNVYDKAGQDMVLGLKVGTLVEPGVKAVVATTDDGNRIYIYKGDSTMSVTDNTSQELESVSAVPDINISGDYTYALIKQSINKNKADIGYASVVTAYSFATDKMTLGDTVFTDDFNNNLGVIRDGVISGSEACVQLDKLLTDYVNTYLYATNTGIDIDSFSADHADLYAYLKKDFSKDVVAGYASLITVLAVNISSSTITTDSDESNIETLCSEHVYMVISPQDLTEADRIQELFKNGCVTLTADSAPVTKETIDTIRSNYPGAIMYLLTDDAKYHILATPGSDDIYIKKVVSS